MLRVNLLAWRERQIERRYRLWCRRLLLCVGGVALGMLLYGWHIQWLNAQREAQLAMLVAHQLALQHKLDEVQALKQQHRLAEKLNQQSQARFRASLHIVQLLRHLAQSMPEGVWATGFSHDGARFLLDGEGASYGEILTLADNLRHEVLLPAVQLREVRQLPAENMHFSINATPIQSE